jgi:hypothetical protein
MVPASDHTELSWQLPGFGQEPPSLSVIDSKLLSFDVEKVQASRVCVVNCLSLRPRSSARGSRFGSSPALVTRTSEGVTPLAFLEINRISAESSLASNDPHLETRHVFRRDSQAGSNWHGAGFEHEISGSSVPHMTTVNHR